MVAPGHQQQSRQHGITSPVLLTTATVASEAFAKSVRRLRAEPSLISRR
jgi:hypothetical protein